MASSSDANVQPQLIRDGRRARDRVTKPRTKSRGLFRRAFETDRAAVIKATAVTFVAGVANAATPFLFPLSVLGASPGLWGPIFFGTLATRAATVVMGSRLTLRLAQNMATPLRLEIAEHATKVIGRNLVRHGDQGNSDAVPGVTDGRKTSRWRKSARRPTTESSTPRVYTESDVKQLGSAAVDSAQESVGNSGRLLQEFITQLVAVVGIALTFGPLTGTAGILAPLVLTTAAMLPAAMGLGLGLARSRKEHALVENEFETGTVVRSRWDRFNRGLLQVLGVYNAADRVVDALREPLEEQAKASLLKKYWRMNTAAMVQGFGLLSMAAPWAVGVLFNLPPSLTLGAMTLGLLVQPAMMMIPMVASQLREGRQNLERIERFNELGSSQTSRGVGLSVMRSLMRAPVIELRNASCRAETGTETVLTDVNLKLTMDPGIVAVLAKTGTAKSTLIKLILGIIPAIGDERLPVTEHERRNSRSSVVIRSNETGVERGIRELSDYELSKIYAYAAQESEIEGDTVADWLRIRSPDTPDADLAALLRRLELVKSTEEGLRVLRESPSKVFVSGGERKRLALAPTLIADALVLVLDEPTSALDPETEGIIWRELRNVAREKKIFLTTHAAGQVYQAGASVIFLDRPPVTQGWTKVSGNTIVEHARVPREYDMCSRFMEFLAANPPPMTIEDKPAVPEIGWRMESSYYNIYVVPRDKADRHMHRLHGVDAVVKALEKVAFDLRPGAFNTAAIDDVRSCTADPAELDVRKVLYQLQMTFGHDEAVVIMPATHHDRVLTERLIQAETDAGIVM